MTIEYKAVGVTGVTEDIANNGVITAIVAVTGIVDRVNDIIEPGAVQKSLAQRTPKGVWHHDWKSAVSRTEEIKELYPGDPDLPSTLPDGRPWPAEAGALRVKMRFNLNTQRGRDAYEDVKFFGPQQEWSIGYMVPKNGATIDKATGARRIQEMALYEYSPVLFGAMPAARTTSVKEAQRTFAEVKAAHGEGTERFLNGVRDLMGDFEFKQSTSRQEELTDEEPNEEQEDIEEGIDLDDDGKEIERDDDWSPYQKKGEGVAMQAKTIKRAIDALSELLNEAESVEVKADKPNPRRVEEVEDDELDDDYYDEEEDDVPLDAEEVEKKSLVELVEMAGLDVQGEARALEYHAERKSVAQANENAAPIIAALEEALEDDNHHTLGAVAFKMDSILSDMADRIEGVIPDYDGAQVSEDGSRVTVDIKSLLGNL